MDKHKCCCFIGHRNIEQSEELRDKIRKLTETLIVEKGVTYFLFGSKSNFNSLCLEIVSELKLKYPFVKRIGFTAKNEGVILEKDKAKYQKVLNNSLNCVDEEFEHKNKQVAGKGSYVERNQSMIDHSDFCVFYYDETYRPKPRKSSKQSVTFYQPKSGTAVAYIYAQKMTKTIINVKK